MWKSRALLSVVGSVFVAMAALGVSSRALAFSNPSDYALYPFGPDVSRLGGGAGRFYTGSPADAYTCENCHSAKSNYSFPVVQTGLPLDGYIPGREYKIEISSPVANMQLAAARMSGNDPISSLTAEFIAQDGGPAGTVKFVSDSDLDTQKFPGLWCPTVATAEPGNQVDEYGMIIYRVDTGSASTELTLRNTREDPERFPTCAVEQGRNEDGADYERRCVVTTKPCGVQSVKFLWTAPSKWSGPIWFSMGFVATYNRSIAPNDDDFVTTMTVALNPGYDGPTHETVLSSGCSVASGPHAGSVGGGLALVLATASLWLIRRRQRRTLPLLAAGVVLSMSVGCTDAKGLVVDPPSPVGAYESIGCVSDCNPPPTCRKGSWPDAGTPDDYKEALKTAPPMMGSGLGLGAAGDSAGGAAGEAGGSVPAGAAGSDAPMKGPKSLGSMSITFTSAQPADWISTYEAKCEQKPCKPHYVTAWIEDANHQFVRQVLDQKGAYILLSLTNYFRMGTDCQNPKDVLGADVTTTATLFEHKAHTVTWDGRLGNGNKAAQPGTYRLRIEVAIDETQHIPVSDIPFMFGDPAPYSMPADPQAAHTGVTLTYTPNP